VNELILIFEQDRGRAQLDPLPMLGE